MSALDRIEQRARERGGEGLGGFVALGVPDVLALVDIARAAQEVSRIEASGVLPDFRPLAQALAALSVGETSGGEGGA